MRTEDFDYYLPSEKIAQSPVRPRGRAKMLYFKRQSEKFMDCQVADLPNLLQAGDLLVFNTTRVRQARLFGERQIGDRKLATELLVLKQLDDFGLFSVLLGGKKIETGQEILLSDQKTIIKIIGHENGGPTFVIKVSEMNTREFFNLCEKIGRLPLPPYIHNRSLSGFEQQLYQPVVAKTLGSVAAPTASLHFDQALLNELIGKGLNLGELVLHVGLGTFWPVRSELIEEHKMHREEIEVSEKLVRQINQTKTNGGRVIAIGTTVVRALESAAVNDFRPTHGTTDLFIVPGYRFKVIDGMLTNFHLPKSTLLMMVSAFIGRENLFNIYQHALSSDYRFLSFGDCMLLL